MEFPSASFVFGVYFLIIYNDKTNILNIVPAENQHVDIFIVRLRA